MNTAWLVGLRTTAVVEEHLLTTLPQNTRMYQKGTSEPIFPVYVQGWLPGLAGAILCYCFLQCSWIQWTLISQVLWLGCFSGTKSLHAVALLSHGNIFIYLLNEPPALAMIFHFPVYPGLLGRAASCACLNRAYFHFKRAV